MTNIAHVLFEDHNYSIAVEETKWPTQLMKEAIRLGMKGKVRVTEFRNKFRGDIMLNEYEVKAVHNVLV